MKTSDIFKELRDKARLYYDSVNEVYCPALEARVIFNAEGFHHLRYNCSLSERSKPEQRNKLAYIPQAVEIIKKTTTVQEVREFLEPVGLKDKNGLRKTAHVTYFGFWAMLEKNIRIKVIVRRIDGGQYFFRSLMPFWFERVVNGRIVRYFTSPKISTE